MRFLLSVMLFWPAAVSAQDTFSIKPYLAKKGDIADVRREQENVRTTEIFDPQGNPLQKRIEKRGTVSEYRTALLASPDQENRVTKAERIYTLDERIRDGVRTKTTLHGKKITIEQEDAGYVFHFADGSPITGEDLQTLKSSFRPATGVILGTELLPKTPVKRNETWAIDPAVLAKSLKDQFEVDEKRTTAVGKLTEVYAKDGKQWGKLEFVIDLRIKSFQSLAVSKESYMKLTAKQDRVIDGSSDDGSETSEIETQLEATNEAGLRIRITGTQKGKKSEKLVPR